MVLLRLEGQRTGEVRGNMEAEKREGEEDEEETGYAGESMDGEDDERVVVKPVFLKGLFRCVHIETFFSKKRHPLFLQIQGCDHVEAACCSKSRQIFVVVWIGCKCSIARRKTGFECLLLTSPQR